MATFAIAPGKVTCSADAAHMPTARYGYAGNREMKCAPTLSLMQHLTKMTGATPDPKKIYDWLKTASPEAIAAYDSSAGEAGRMHTATVGPSDIIFLPAAWTFHETNKGADFVGMRAVLFFPGDLDQLDEMKNHLVACCKPNQVLEDVIGALASM